MEPLGNYNKATTCSPFCDNSTRGTHIKIKVFFFRCLLSYRKSSEFSFSFRFAVRRLFVLQTKLCVLSVLLFSPYDCKNVLRSFAHFLLADIKFYMGTCATHPRTSFDTRFHLITKFFN